MTSNRISLARLVRRGATAALILAGAAACSPDSVLNVDDPDVATPGSLADKSALPVLRTGAIGDFAVAFDGGDDNVVTYTGLLADELLNAETFPTRIEIDQRSVQPVNSSLEGVYRSLHRARASARRAADAFALLDSTNVARLEVLNLEAMTMIFFAEQYCNGIALSTLTAAGEQIYGAQKTGAELNQMAVAIFDSVLTFAGTSVVAAVVTQADFARVGKGRALLNLNQPAAAATAVAAVSTAYAYQLQHSENSARQNNGIYSTGAVNRRFSVTGTEGVNGLPYRLDADPRVVAPRGTGSASTGFDGSTPLYLPATKFPNRSASSTVAGGREARLIQAEASLIAGNAAAALATLNTLRTGVAGLTPLATVTTDILFKERAYWMWLEGHRLGDLRRLVRNYGRTVATTFPTGAYFKGGVFGPDVNFPIPVAEDNNPTNRGCFDRNP